MSFKVKICEICWDEFHANTKNQKYCKECGKNPYKAKKHFEISEWINKKNAGDLEPKPVQNVCECGKILFSIYGTKTCRNCIEMKRIYNAKCPICNSLLFDKGIKSGRGFCSEKCRKISQIKKAKEKGNYIKCKICNREFISKNYSNIFCCRECFKKNNEIEKEKQKNIIIFSIVHKKCKICNIIFPLIKNKMKQFCSRECSQKYQKQVAQISREFKSNLNNLNNVINLCTTCRTSYRDCERMQSNFVYRPKGAITKEIKGKYIIISCPKFK